MMLGRAVVSLALGAALLPAAPSGTAAGVAAKPSNFRVFVNGRMLTNAQLATAGDTYIPAKAGRLTVAVRWTTNLRGTNHQVRIVDVRSKNVRRCTSGTSCSLTTSKPLAVGDETSWSIQILRGGKLVSEKAVCLIGKR
jgi:hypothetical protein